MEKKRAGKWIVSFFALVLAILIFLSALVFLIDPFFQFRVRDHSYMLSGWFVSSGLIRNHDYDTLILGSSMTQNFNMDRFREELGAEPLHIGLGGIEPVEMKELIDLAYEAEKADTYYIGVDTYAFTTQVEESRYPEYLLREDFLSRCRYFFSYEVWFRYLPVDLCLLLLDRLGVELPVKFAYSRSIDRLEDWSLNASYGEERMQGSFPGESHELPQADTEAIYQQMRSCVDRYLDSFHYEKGEHIFFLVPYSSLYWCDMENSGRMAPYLRAKAYFVEQAIARGAAVYDFQAADFTMDLDNYSDPSHYCPEINDWMVECFANGDCLVNMENFDAVQNRLLENTKQFRESYAHRSA